jgi:hypothetical protein
MTAGADAGLEGGDLLDSLLSRCRGVVGLTADLDATDDDVVSAAAGAVVGLPFALDQSAADGDRAAVGQVFRAGVGLGADGGDVDEHRGLSGR